MSKPMKVRARKILKVGLKIQETVIGKISISLSLINQYMIEQNKIVTVFPEFNIQ